MVTEFRLGFSTMEDVGYKNMENLILAYPGNLNCSEDRDCKSRQDVAKSNFKGAVDVYADLTLSMQAVCVTKNPHIPHDVLVTNMAEGRPLDDAAGFNEAGYVPSGARLQTQLRGIHDLYTGTQGTIPNLLARRFRRTLLEKRFLRSVTIKRRRRAIMGIALGALAIGTIVNSVQINVVSAEVSKLGKEIAVLQKRADSNMEHTLALMSNVGSEVRLNSYFDTIGQIITMSRRDGEELVKVVRSTSTGELDPASRRELAEVVSKQMIPFGGGKVDNSQFQEL